MTCMIPSPGTGVLYLFLLPYVAMAVVIVVVCAYNWIRRTK